MDRVTVAHSAQEMESFESAWRFLESAGRYTIFQSFRWNQLAARIFSGRENPHVVFAETEGGMAIVPAAIAKHGISLLGEELFDYRDVLAMGDGRALASAWRTLAKTADDRNLDFKVKGVRGSSHGLSPTTRSGFHSSFFANAPAVRRSDALRKHPSRLDRNFQRMLADGCELKVSHGHDIRLVRNILQLKAEEDNTSLFHDPSRIEMACTMAQASGEDCEIFTLLKGNGIIAALVTFRDRDHELRRLYTIYYNKLWARYSPGRSLMQYVIQSSLGAELDVDLMTGEQPYKQRFATFSEPLYTLRATPQMLFELAESELPSKSGRENELSCLAG